MPKNTGRDYEEFVGSIQQSIFNAEESTNIRNINVEVNKKIKDSSGITRQFDVYWEFRVGDYDYKTVIECKDYASSVTIEKIDAFIGKTQYIPGLRLIYATKTGYQNGAQIRAKQHNIELLIVRKMNDADWVADDGTPLVKIIKLNMIINTPPRITSFSPLVDAVWLQSQPNINVDEINKKFSSTVDAEIFITDENNKKSFSVYELANLLTNKIKNIKYGEGEFSEKLDNSYLETADESMRIKIGGYHLNYTYNEPMKVTSAIDYSEDILGIVQKYLSGDKKIIFKDGRIK
ncbi:restriction endonuclease [Pantoea ananatis]|uniref:restriction endonuclease n=1 Tax=Pantoea ananas TaxID=553 RepID=UPI00351D2306